MEGTKTEETRIPANLMMVVCGVCEGKGKIHRYQPCNTCHGAGEIGPWERMHGDNFQGQRCPKCDSDLPAGVPSKRGKVYLGQETCDICRGHGRYYLEPDKAEQTQGNT